MRGIAIKKTWMKLSVLLWIVVLGLSFEQEVCAKEISTYIDEKPTLNNGIPGVEDADVILTDDFLERVTSQADEESQSDEENLITSVKSSELNTPHNWTVTIDGRTITAVIHNENGVDNAYTLLNIYDSQGTELLRQVGTILNKTSTIGLDLSDTITYADGTYSIMLFEGKDVGSTVYMLTSYNIQIMDGVVSFAPGGCSLIEQAFIDDLNANYNPELYDEIPLKYYPGEGSMDAGNLDEMVAKAKELTADCTTDEEKMRVIHDWICEEFAYDYEALLIGDIANAADAEWVFENKRAVCSGFSRMGQIMLTAVGVPCMNVFGYGDSSGVSADAISRAANHEWNVVYLNDSWRIMDITWDCENRYFGSYNGSNSSYVTTLGNAPSYTYYGIPVFAFGITHCSQYLFGVEYDPWYSDAYVESIALQNTPTAVFELNDTFSGSYNIICYMSDGSTKTRTIDGREYATGYDMTKNGYQMIELSYGGKTLTYEILVGKGCDGEHTYATWTTILEATCVADGLKKANCTECNKYCEEVITSETVHVLESETTTAEPTCMTKGSKVGVCILCKEEVVCSIPVVEHEYETTFTIDTEANCKDAGIQSRHCKWYDVCGNVADVIEIEKTGIHVGGIASCTQQAICEICHQQYGEWKAHTAGDWIVVVEPTDTTEGSKVRSCIVCNQVMEAASIAKKEAVNTKDESDAGETDEDDLETKDNSDIEEDWDDLDMEEEDWDEEDDSEELDEEESDEDKVTVGTEITINKCRYRVTSIGKSPTVTFVKVLNKSSVKSCTVPTKITFVGKKYKVTSVESKAFSGCKKLEKVVLPDTITKLGSNVFDNCKKLKTITIKSSKLKTLHKKTFSGVTKKTVIKVPKKKVNTYKKLFRKKGLSKTVVVKK